MLLIAMALAAYIGYAYAKHLNQLAYQRNVNAGYITEFEQCIQQNKATKNHEMICLHLTDLEF